MKSWLPVVLAYDMQLIFACIWWKNFSCLPSYIYTLLMNNMVKYSWYGLLGIEEWISLIASKILNGICDNLELIDSGLIGEFGYKME